MIINFLSIIFLSKSSQKHNYMKHDEIIDDIFSKLKGKKLYKIEYEYKKLKGECDILSYFNNKLYLYEVKSTDKQSNRNKALEQLIKDYIYFSNYYIYDKAYLFYIHSYKKSYKVELIGVINYDYKTLYPEIPRDLFEKYLEVKWKYL